MSGRVGRTTVVYFASQVGRSIAGFLATWFIANRLGATILGEYAAVVALLFWLNVPASAIGRAMNKRISEEGETDPYLAAGHLLNAAVTLCLAVGIVLAADEVNALVGGHPVALLIAILVATQGAFDLVLDSLRGTKRVGASGWLKTVEQVLRAAFQIAVVLASVGFAWLVVGHIAALALSALVGAFYLRRVPRGPTRTHVRRLLTYARYGWLGTIKTRAFAWMDTLVMSAFAAFVAIGGVTHGQIGIYEAAWSVASMLGLVSVAISQTLFPELSELSAEDDYEQVRHLVNEGLAFTGVFAIPGLFGAAVVGGDLLTIYRPEFARGKWILVILVAARLLSSYGSQLVNAINAIDRPDVAFRINLGFLGVNLVGNVVLVALFGWYGAAVATAASAGLIFLAGAYSLVKLIGSYDVPYREIGYQVLAATAMFLVVAGLKRLVPNGVVTAVGLVSIGAAVYGLALLALSTRFRRKARAVASV